MSHSSRTSYGPPPYGRPVRAAPEQPYTAYQSAPTTNAYNGYAPSNFSAATKSTVGPGSAISNTKYPKPRAPETPAAAREEQMDRLRRAQEHAAAYGLPVPSDTTQVVPYAQGSPMSTGYGTQMIAFQHPPQFIPSGHGSQMDSYGPRYPANMTKEKEKSWSDGCYEAYMDRENRIRRRRKEKAEMRAYGDNDYYSVAEPSACGPAQSSRHAARGYPALRVHRRGPVACGGSVYSDQESGASSRFAGSETSTIRPAPGSGYY